MLRKVGPHAVGMAAEVPLVLDGVVANVIVAG